MDYFLFYRLPIVIGALVIFAILIAATEVGYRAGLWKRDVWKNAEAGGGNLVLTSMFALLGLILAFTFAAGVSHYQQRKQAVIAEANALGTAFLRADLVADPGRTALKGALYDYARTRTVKAGDSVTPAAIRDLIDRSSEVKARLWPIVQQILQQAPPGPIEASLVASVNEVLDMHTIRIAAFFDKLPRLVIVMLVFVAAATLLVAGFNSGVSGRISRWRISALALVLTGVMLVIVDFDRPVSGFVRVSQDSIHSTIADMEADLGR